MAVEMINTPVSKPSLALARFFAIALAAGISITPAFAEDQPVYKTGIFLMRSLGRDLYTQLPKEAKAMIATQPISVVPDAKPFVRIKFEPDEPKPFRGVEISAGFSDLANNLAHAASIDKLVKKGYLKAYIAQLAKEKGDSEILPLPDIQKKEYWTDDILNDQQSNFNCIVGMSVSIKLANHYLGHYDKYKDKLLDSQGVPIPLNNLLTEKEWDECFEGGAENAINGGCTVEGTLPFYEAFDKMEKRPPWVAYFMPDFAKYAKMRKQLQAVQKRVMHGS